MLSVFAGGYAMGLIFNLFAVNDYMALPAYYHFVMGGFAFWGCFYGKLILFRHHKPTEVNTYTDSFIGLMAVLIRVVNPAYPEGMMLAILSNECICPANRSLCG
ncbi:MAG: RnfABCDGE type electron transport complex subunit D [Bacteroidales bacterium]